MGAVNEDGICRPADRLNEEAFSAGIKLEFKRVQACKAIYGI
jgi:hypothetical protein